MPSELERELFRWMLGHNLNLLVQFHNGMQALLAEKARELEPSGEPQLRYTIELYRAMNSANALLLLFGFLEEMLRLFWSRHLPDHPLPISSSIDRYKPLLREELRLDLGSLRCWQILKDAGKLRDCILHANGRISLMRDAEAIRGCIVRYSDMLTEHHDRVTVTAAFLRLSVDAAWELRDEILRAQERLELNGHLAS